MFANKLLQTHCNSVWNIETGWYTRKTVIGRFPQLNGFPENPPLSLGSICLSGTLTHTQVRETLIKPIRQIPFYLFTADSNSIRFNRIHDWKLLNKTYLIRSGGLWGNSSVICVNHGRVLVLLGARLQKIQQPQQEGTRSRMREKWRAEWCCAEYSKRAGASFLENKLALLWAIHA